MKSAFIPPELKIKAADAGNPNKNMAFQALYASLLRCFLARNERCFDKQRATMEELLAVIAVELDALSRKSGGGIQGSQASPLHLIINWKHMGGQKGKKYLINSHQ